MVRSLLHRLQPCGIRYIFIIANKAKEHTRSASGAKYIGLADIKQANSSQTMPLQWFKGMKLMSTSSHISAPMCF
jgi:hypothetical protein